MNTPSQNLKAAIGDRLSNWEKIGPNEYFKPNKHVEPGHYFKLTLNPRVRKEFASMAEFYSSVAHSTSCFTVSNIQDWHKHHKYDYYTNVEHFQELIEL